VAIGSFSHDKYQRSVIIINFSILQLSDKEYFWGEPMSEDQLIGQEIGNIFYITLNRPGKKRPSVETPVNSLEANGLNAASPLHSR